MPNTKGIMRKSIVSRRTLPCFVLVLVLAPAIFAQRRERSITTWQPTHFDINVVFDQDLTRLTSANVAVTVLIDRDGINLIDLDFGAMPVSKVEIGGSAVKFEQHDQMLDVQLPQPAAKGKTFILTINYSGKPADGLILTKDADGLPSAIGDNWPDRVHNWIPCLDHPSAKASVKYTVTAPANDEVTANGALLSVKNGPAGSKTWVYEETHAISPYNMVVAVGQFATGPVSGTNSPVPVTYYVAKSSGPIADKGFSPAIPSLLTFSDLVAPYPFKKLALIVGATQFGGMENANTIVFTPAFFSNFQTASRRSAVFGVPSGVEETEAHEIAHQWFGDTVTEKTWSDLWLSEGFATYFAGLFLERIEGKTTFHDYMKRNASIYFTYEKQRRIPIFDTQTEKLFDLLNPNNYQKGSWVLHGLRGILGDKAFFDGLKIYYDSHKDSTATSEDLRAALEKASGKDLRDFFDRWVYKAGHPVYQVSWAAAGEGKKTITLRQLQQDDAFMQPVTLLIRSGAGVKRLVMQPTGKESTMEVAVGIVDDIVVDPDDYILKEVVK